LQSAPAPTLPNIVYILATIWAGASRLLQFAISCADPNADRFATQGIRFTDMHSPSAVCTPTRYGILTGRYCWRSKLKERRAVGLFSNLIEEDG